MRRLSLALFVSLYVISGCSTAYYSAWEKLGYEKRDILVSRVEKGKDDQEAAKKQFKTTLEQFQDLTHFNGGDLEAEYKTLSSAYDDCNSRATAVSSRIASIDSVAQDMFSEWNAELAQYDNPQLRDKSKQELNDAKGRYSQYLAAMRRSEASMQPVLRAFKDQVLFLKHNLNAQAISSLQGTAAGIDTDVQNLIKEMDASINEANSFVDHMKS